MVPLHLIVPPHVAVYSMHANRSSRSIDKVEHGKARSIGLGNVEHSERERGRKRERERQTERERERGRQRARAQRVSASEREGGGGKSPD